MLLKEALTHVARYAGRCGFLYNKHDISIAKTIIRNSCHIESLPQLTYGYTSNIKTDVNNSSSGKVTAKENNTKVDLMKLLEIENYINTEGKVKFEDVTLRDRSSINSSESAKEIRIPVVLFVINGGLDTLEHVIRAIYTNISVVVVKGTGGTADLIALCLKDMTKVKRKLPAMFAKRFSDDMYEKVEEILNRIVKRDWMISIFNVKKNNHKELWEKLTDGIMRAWSFEEKKDESYLKTDLMILSQMDFISKYVAEIDSLSKKELFGGYDMQTQSKSRVDLQHVQHTFVNAFVGTRTDIIQQILSSNENFALSKQQFTTLCQEVVKSRTSTPGKDMNGFKLLENVHPEAVIYLANGKGKGFKDTQDAIRSISNKLLQGLCFSKLGLVTCCKKSKKSDETAYLKLPEKIPVIESLRVAIMGNNVELAAELWSNCDNPMLTALVSNVYLTAMANKAEQLFEETLQADILSHSRKFTSRAVTLLDKMFIHNETMATKALDYVSEVWDHKESPLHFGHQFNMEEFISHPSAQKDASKRMFPYVNEEDTTVTLNKPTDGNTTKNVKSRECLPYIKDHLRLGSAWTLLKAPVTKLSIHVIFFVTALVMFSYFLTRDLQRKISILEGMIFFYMCGDLLEELWSMIRPEDCSWSIQRVLLHLFDIWNILDFVCFILYIVGFGLHYYHPDLLLHTRRIYSVALFVMFLRFLNLLLLIKRFGIIIIMIKEMLVDLAEYLVILIILMFAAGIVYHANVYPNHTVKAFPRDIQYWQIWSILKIPYWQVYGELNLDVLEGSEDTGCTSNSTVWKNDPSISRCPTSDWLPPVIAAIYMMLTNWLLLNIVIAMFSARFNLIMTKSSQKWRYHRHSVVIEYEHKIPSPLNIPFRVLIILFYVMCYLPFYLCDECTEETIQGHGIDEMLQRQREFARVILEEEKDKGLI
ncbi:transient receptor potential cation channel subfamily M member-like 2 [Mytilus galloprovincialis]|uniref:transient receptor potential cation channel subfamily M member-like 2 n=1 Tax=Mytilus galloprovincialis TaxID=29158 RepID=UPI003F7B5A74